VLGLIDRAEKDAVLCGGCRHLLGKRGIRVAEHGQPHVLEILLFETAHREGEGAVGCQPPQALSRSFRRDSEASTRGNQRRRSMLGFVAASHEKTSQTRKSQPNREGFVRHI
jgi:hypothetical protein